VLAIALAVAGLGLAVAILVARDLRGSLDTALRERAVEVSRLSVSAPALLTAPGALGAPLGGRDLAVEVLDRRGRIVARSSSLGGRLLPGGSPLSAALARGESGFRDARLSGDAMRLYVAPLPADGGPAAGGAVLVGSSTSEIHRTLRRVRIVIVVCALAAAVLGGLLVAYLTGRGLRPLRRLAAAAGAIERSGDASERLPTAPASTEVAELTRTLNGMLGALERARETERRFLADASHELRTPLTALRGNAAYIVAHGADPDALADLEADAERVSRLIEDLLALERAEGAATPGDPVALDELALAAAERNPRVTLGPIEPLTVLGEAHALERALGNLVENALLHGPAGAPVEVGLVAEGGRALLWVRDEGEGIPPEDVEAAFRRFWRGADAGERPGSGLGLSIVRATARRHGGKVTVRGARVTLELPIAPATTSRTRPPPAGRPGTR
jgi:signal transduction histidine kinase